MLFRSPFMRIEAKVSGRAVAAGARRVTADVTVRNEAPTGLGRYAEGPFPGTPYGPGEYAGLLAFEVPRYATGVALTGTAATLAEGSEGTTRVIAGSVRILRGGSLTARLTFVLPAGRTALSVRGSARVPASTWTVGGKTFTDDAVRRIEP